MLNRKKIGQELIEKLDMEKWKNIILANSIYGVRNIEDIKSKYIDRKN